MSKKFPDRVNKYAKSCARTLVLSLLSCFVLAVAYPIIEAHGVGVLKLRETKRYDLGTVQKEYKDPSSSLRPFDISPDSKYLAVNVWVKAVDNQCGSALNCGAHFLGIIDIHSDRLVTHTEGPEAYNPSFALFRPTTPEIVTNFGSDVVILDARNLGLLHRIGEKDEGNSTRSYPISAALSPDGNTLAVVYAVRAEEANSSRKPPRGALRFQFYDLVRSTTTTTCVLGEHEEPFPSFQIALAPDARSFLYWPATHFGDESSLAEYDARTCSVRESWKFTDTPTRAGYSPDGKYLAVVFGGTKPKAKVLVVRRTDKAELWNIPANSLNDMGWPLSISPDSRMLAISTDRHAESWWDAFTEMSHIDDPGIEVRDLQTGRLVAKVRFMSKTSSTVGFVFGTTLLRFTSQSELVALAPDSTIRFYELSNHNDVR